MDVLVPILIALAVLIVVFGVLIAPTRLIGSRPDC
jgi:hypothetical protein